MSHPCLSLAIARLEHGRLLESPDLPEQFAIWALKAPYPGGYVLHNCVWSETLTQTWLSWQQIFSSRNLPHVPRIHYAAEASLSLPSEPPQGATGQPTSFSSRLMQDLGIGLWQWLFDSQIQGSLAQSLGIAMGQNTSLRLRLEIRDPDLIALPWEIMQPQHGKPAISLNPQFLFSRTTSDVDQLPPQRFAQGLHILLVLGQDTEPGNGSRTTGLHLQQEAAALTKILEGTGQPESSAGSSDWGSSHQDTWNTSPIQCKVETLLQPTPAELIQQLETGAYNILFYAGHGEPAPDGGLLFLRPEETLNGTELAQVLVRCQVTLAVFNACWGAQPDQDRGRSLPRSSLAEVLIHHGVPAVLGMRDSITDQEALSFIQAFAQALKERLPIDEAVAVGRKQMLTLYRFNQPAWTLPVLYMHPEFNGELIRPIEPIEESPTELPGIAMTKEQAIPTAYLRLLGGATSKVWPIRGARMRVGRQPENDLVLSELGVSRRHAEIFRRDSIQDGSPKPTYFLRDVSTYGTLVLGPNGWKEIHHEEVELASGVQLKFGSSQSQTLEFIIEG